MVAPRALRHPDQLTEGGAGTVAPTLLVARLRDLLGVQLVAVIAGVRENRTIHNWADGTSEIRDSELIHRLRLAYQITEIIARADSPGVAQTWMQGLNPLLDDQCPAIILRSYDSQDYGQRVLAAAREFVANG